MRIAVVSTLVVVGLALAALHLRTGWYGFSVLLRRGASIWIPVREDDPRLSAAIRLALRAEPPNAVAAGWAWSRIDEGFEVAEMPVVASEAEVDRILLARIDPARFRFEAHNAPAGGRDLGDWMRKLNAVLVINGSFFSPRGDPDTPFLSNGSLLGPRRYDARQGAFVAGSDFVGVRDLAAMSWEQAFRGADNAMVSYPLLLATDGSTRVASDQHWLANRSFVGRDRSGRIVVGTTADAFFSLPRLAEFLRHAGLDLETALNLDGGPLACQGIALNGYTRDFCGRWELTNDGGYVKLLTPLFGQRRWSLPIVLTVLRKAARP